MIIYNPKIKKNTPGPFPTKFSFCLMFCEVRSKNSSEDMSYINFLTILQGGPESILPIKQYLQFQIIQTIKLAPVQLLVRLVSLVEERIRE